jgi:hypothetical protein
MKTFASLTLGLALLSCSTGFAMSKSLPKEIQNEWVRDVEVKTDFALRATDGSLIQFQTSKTHASSGLKNLPAEKGADHSKCGKATDIEITLALTDATLHLIQNGALTAADIKAIQKTPRCEPFLDLLGSLGNLLDKTPSVQSETPDKLTVIKIEKGYALQLTMKSGRNALFRISNKLEGVKSLKDLSRVRLDAETTGQNVAVSFAVTDVSTTDPSRTRSHESCTVYETVRRCDGDRGGRGDRDRHGRDDRGRGDGKDCRTETVSRPGHRRTVSDTTFTSYQIDMTLSAGNGQQLLSAELTDGKFDTRSHDGVCYPDRY